MPHRLSGRLASPIVLLVCDADEDLVVGWGHGRQRDSPHSFPSRSRHGAQPSLPLSHCWEGKHHRSVALQAPDDRLRTTGPRDGSGRQESGVNTTFCPLLLSPPVTVCCWPTWGCTVSQL